ncbi:MAG: TadE/TadG family type IV pilus assembly protein [Anaerolineales bacterium]|jgi:Flp pilus assembly protein TadG
MLKSLRARVRGQSLVETAFLLPVLLILLSGLVELGFMLNQYLTVLDAERNAARFAADGSYDVTDADPSCATTRDFYRQTACLVLEELGQEQPTVTLNPSTDDIVVSAFAATTGGTISARFPSASGWSYYGNDTSTISDATLGGELNSTANNDGYVLVEVFYTYHQILRLPWITPFIPDPVLLHIFTVMPLASVQPTPTP